MSSPVLAAQTPLPFREQPVLVQASRPLLPEGETLAGSQNGVGLYVNGERLPRFNAGTLYITSYRLLWVGEYSSGLALNTDCATSVIGFALSSILRLDSLSGFFTSSPKLILRIKVDSDGGNGQTHIPESVRISATVPFLSDPWRCSICEFANTNTADKCEHCGVQRIKSISKSGSEGLRYCPKCTCLNGIAAVTCEACGQLLLPLPPNNTSQDQQLATSAKSDIACPHCTYINASNAVTCEMCRGSLRLESGSQKDISTTVRRTDNSESSTLSTSALSQSVYEVKLSFRKGGMQALQGVLKRAMQRQAWNELSTLPSSSIDHTVRATQSLDALSESNTSAGAHINNDGSNSASAGLTSIISRNEQRAAGNKATLQSAFQDLDALMAKAAEMVKLAGSISDKIKINNASASESVSQGSTSSADAITSEETIQFRDFLVNLGIEGGAATKEGSGSSYHQELAKELVVFMDRLLGVQASAGSRSQGYKRQHTVGAIIPLADLYCMFNRTRGIGGLVSPSDLIAAMNLLQSCQGGRAAENVYSFKHFLQTGLLAIQCGQHFLDKQVMERIAGYLNEVQQVTVIGTETGDNVWRSVSGFELAKRENVSLVLANEFLLLCEANAIICRDESVQGVRFYSNPFK